MKFRKIEQSIVIIIRKIEQSIVITISKIGQTVVKLEQTEGKMVATAATEIVNAHNVVVVADALPVTGNH